MKLYYNTIIIGLLLISCGQEKQSELPEFPVDINQNISLSLSEIAEEITSVELELTDESMINSDNFMRVIITENNIILAEIGGLFTTRPVLVFNRDGKFVRSVGSNGQGPGEYSNILNVAFDEKNSRLFILSNNPDRIICYQSDGTFLKEARLNLNSFDYDILYNNNELFFVCMGIIDRHNTKKSVYRMNENLQVKDSIICFESYFEDSANEGPFASDYIIKNQTSIYIYSKEVYSKWDPPTVKVSRDTLYRLEENKLIPELKLKFANNGFDRYGDKIIDLFNFYRSSRYIFANYKYNPNNRERNTEFPKMSYFCYDTKTGKGYNMLEGYTDDINRIEERVIIHPLTTNSEYFYYWHTNMHPNDLQEPNPTLYIGKLKK
ncbi:6-bladed beta-propeller [Parabacteroides sp. OttesenSCG-928-G21]|nr:6-bladed beta-propeller [Parabacteroides sp. OttesenSCG-928-G21]